MVRRGRCVLATLTDDDLTHSPYPHFRHPIPRVPRQGALTLLGDAAHTMPPTLAQGTNQALLDTMVLCKALSGRRKTDNGAGDLSSALRWYRRPGGARSLPCPGWRRCRCPTVSPC